MRYIPSSISDRQQMLSDIGIDSIEQLFAGIPERLRLRSLLNIPRSLTEPELIDYFRQRAARNAVDYTSFLGAGVYRHHIPIVIDALISRSEFFTAYTPYQPEIAQGTLQAIFEFQTYIAQLTGMELANASLYDGSTGLAEAVLMAYRITRRSKFLIAGTVHPEYRAVVATYAHNLGLELETLEYGDSGRIDPDDLASRLGSDVAAVVIQTPNFFGTIEHVDDISQAARAHGALTVVNIAEAASTGILKPPKEADIVVGEGQSFGVPMSFGGPHVGFIATRERYVRQMPGRLVGMGQDSSGRRAFVLTLSTREQHIRREKATSNICTNQSLCALMATVYLAVMGPQGLREVAEQNIMKTDYAVQQVRSRTPHKILFPAPRFNEFVIQLDDYRIRAQRLLKNKMVPGLQLSRFYPKLENSMLTCVTETTTKEQIDAFVKELE